ncbi:hypothetical protein [Leeuwenhoekiella marinoflava]|uniref:hypothetical protein n=1 Tax=Leeuwenhoekiella marinoflava TaxID=988 RepID=UPI0030011D8E
MFGKFKRIKAEKDLKNSRSELKKAIDDNITSSQTSIDDISEILADFKKHKYSKHDAFLNLCIFSDIVNIDLSILLEKLRIAEREQEKKLFARVIAVTLIDYLDNISVLIGRDCLRELKTNNMNEFIYEFKSIHKRFSKFKKEKQQPLREIRNKTLAHKSKDALELNDYLKKLDVESVYQNGLEVKKLSKEFIDLSTKVILFIADYMKAGRKL